MPLRCGDGAAMSGDGSAPSRALKRRDAPPGAVKTRLFPMVAGTFGRPFISNPDFPRRLAEKLPLAPDDRETWFTQEFKGYTDYPTADAATPASASTSKPVGNEASGELLH